MRNHTTMTYQFCVIKLFGVLALLSVVNPLVASVDCKTRPPRVDPNKCCAIPNIITKEMEEKCKSFMPLPPSPPPASPSPSGESISSENFNSDEFRSPHHHCRHRRPMVSCFMSCVLNETGILTAHDSKLNEEKLSAYLQTTLVNDTDMIPVVETSFKTCALKVEEMHLKFREVMQKKTPIPTAVTTESTMSQYRMVHPPHYPIFVEHLMRCVFKETVINCPANKWTNTSECNELRDRMKNCKPPMLSDKSKDFNATEEM